MGADPTLHELVKNICEKFWILLWSLLLPTPKRTEGCLLQMPFEAYILLPHPGPVLCLSISTRGVSAILDIITCSTSRPSYI